MATTEQRSGFRLPWATEPQSNEGTDPDNVHADGVTETTTDPTNPKATVTQDTATIAPGSTPWPTTDESPAKEPTTPEPSPGAAHDAVSDAAPVARRANPLVAGLVRAMRDAAKVARDEALARVADEAKSRIETIHAESADGAAAIRRQADQDVTAVREWSKAEMARIREETDRRIAARRRRLDVEVEDEAARVEHRIERVQAVVATFDAAMDGFFQTLLAEEDPARLAGFAEQLPESPSFDDEAEMLSWAAPRTLDSSNAAAAEADALSGLDDGDVAAPPTGSPDVDSSVIDRLARFAAPLREPEETTISLLSVTGLHSVAGISGFKRAVAKAPGITGVTVASGPGGDFMFTVRHALSIDLTALVTALEGFGATMSHGADGALAVAVTEPETAR